jgi:hypothetical protein
MSGRKGRKGRKEGNGFFCFAKPLHSEKEKARNTN